jgi:AcrR family transcriptional regulator
MDTQTESSRRERKKDATRVAIREAALELALKNGVEHVTVEAISEAADVSPRTFFNYFASKEDALIGEDPESAERLKAAIIARPTDETAFQAVRAALREGAVNRLGKPEIHDIRQHYRLIRQNPVLLEHQTAKFHRFEQTLAQAVAERLGTDTETDPYPELVAAVTVTCVRFSFQRWACNGRKDGNLEEVFDESFKQIEKGL